MKKIVSAFIGISLLVFPSLAAERSISLSERQLELMLLSQMPFERSLSVVDFIVTRPDVYLDSDNNKIGVAGDISITAPDIHFSGTVALSGRVELNTELGQVFLKDVTIDEFDFNNLPESLQIIQGFVEFVLELAGGFALDAIPVYTFSKKDVKQQLLNASLKDIRVENGELEIVFVK